jgi:hypothetical protein
MKFRLFVILAALVLAGPAFAQKAYIDFDKEYDFDSIKTFAWAKTPETSVEEQDPLMHSRIVNAIEHYLSQAGFTEVEQGDTPDIYVTYHTSTKEEMSLNTTNFGYGYPGGWHYGGYWGGGFGTSSTTVSTWQVGTLVVDAWDSDSKNLVWRGMATNITVSPNPDKMMKRIDKSLAKIVKASQKAFEKEAKAKAAG